MKKKAKLFIDEINNTLNHNFSNSNIITIYINDSIGYSAGFLKSQHPGAAIICNKCNVSIYIFKNSKSGRYVLNKKLLNCDDQIIKNIIE